MKQPFVKPESVFAALQIIGISLMFSFWIFEGGISGFFLIAALAMMAVLRRRVPKLKYSIFADVVLCVFVAGHWGDAVYFLALPIFTAMYFGLYLILLTGIYLLLESNALLTVMLLFSAALGLFLRLWAYEYNQKQLLRDNAARRHYEMEEVHDKLTTALADVERMAGISERTRIARDIHDNAGHEIVAAYISFQAIKKLLSSEEIRFNQKGKILEMYDNALKRLNNGTGKIRETAHNLQSTTSVGVDCLSEICHGFPMCLIDFRIHGDTSRIPMYVWSVLSSCLKECLTNIARHSQAKSVAVTLDATQHIVRLCIENDGVPELKQGTEGIGLRNLRQRTRAIGGSLSVDASDVFRVICVLPIKEDVQDESADC